MSVKSWMKRLCGREYMWDWHPLRVQAALGGCNTHNIRTAQKHLRAQQEGERLVLERGAVLERSAVA